MRKCYWIAVLAISLCPLFAGTSQAAKLVLIGRDGAERCLQSQNGSSANGTPVILAPCHDGASENWIFDGNGYITGIGGKCLDVKDGSRADNTPVILYTCSTAGALNQKWVYAAGFVYGFNRELNAGKVVLLQALDGNGVSPAGIKSTAGPLSFEWEIR